MNRQVPFQVEDWGSDYRVALGLSSNASVFSNKNMLVFLLTQNQMKNVTNFKIWWYLETLQFKRPMLPRIGTSSRIIGKTGH